jgi:Zn-finger nucleic acid-binding protein
MWLEMGALARLASSAGDFPDFRFSDTSAVPSNFPCPKCGPPGHLVTVRYAEGEKVEVELCRRCSGVFLDFKELPEVRRILAAKGLKAPMLERPRRSEELGDESLLRVRYDSWPINLYSLPAALLFAVFVNVFSFPREVLWWLSMPVHECGHAVAGWLGSRFSVPLPLFTAILNADRSPFVYAIFVGGVGYVGYRAYLRRRPYPAVVSAALILGATYFSGIATDATSQMFFTWGGVGGTFALSTFLIASFYYRLPDRFRWDYFRFFALVFGALVFVSSFDFWIEIARGKQVLPTGSAIVGRDDSNGDLNRLLDEFGWTVPKLVRHFVRLGQGCSAVIAAHYAFFLRKAYLRRG